MLINIDRLNDSHKIIKNKIDCFIESFKKNNGSFYINNVKEIISQQNIKFGDFDLNDQVIFNSFMVSLCQYIDKKICTNIINGNNKNNKESSLLVESPSDKQNIYIGSQMLQRGVTIKNLIITYFCNRPLKGVATEDTILQRARWLGYHEHKNLIKVYLSKSAYNDYQDINEDVENMLDIIKNFEKKGKDFRDILSKFYLPSDRLIPTRKTVAKTCREKLDRILWTRTNLDNNGLAEKLFNDIKNDSNAVEIIPNKPFRGIFFNDFNTFIQKAVVDEDYINAEDFFEKIKTDLFKKFIEKVNPQVCIVNMYNLENNDCRLRNETKGRVTIVEGKNPNYIGDIYWNNIDQYKNTLFLQLVKVKIKNTDKIFYKMLMLLPNSLYDFSLEKSLFIQRNGNYQKK